MKIFNINTLIVICLILSATHRVAHSQENTKIGAVNSVQILENSPQAKLARSKIEKEFAPRDKELIIQQKELKALEERLAKDGAIMNENERAKLEREFVNKQRDLKRKQDEFRDDLNFRRNQELKDIQQDIISAINQIATQQNFDIILSESGVLFASEKVDITGIIIQHLESNNE